MAKTKTPPADTSDLAEWVDEVVGTLRTLRDGFGVLATLAGTMPTAEPEAAASLLLLAWRAADSPASADQAAYHSRTLRGRMTDTANTVGSNARTLFNGIL